MRIVAAVVVLASFCSFAYAQPASGSEKALNEARTYYAHNNFAKALTAYSKTDINTLENADVVNYATAAFFMGQFQQSNDIASIGLKRQPGSAAFYRLIFYSNTEMENYSLALCYADSLFHHTDGDTPQYFDYSYYGNALSGVNKHEEAVEAFQHYMQEADNPNANDYASFGRILIQHANAQTDSVARQLSLAKADSVYAQMATRHIDAAEYATLLRARVNNLMDDKQQQGLACPYYEALAELINLKTTLSETDKERLIECYHYLITYHYANRQDYNEARRYAQKMLHIDPDNEIALKIIGNK